MTPTPREVHGVLQAKKPLSTAFLMLPWLFGGTVAVVLALVLLKAGLTAWWPAWLHAAVVLSVGLTFAAVVQLFLVPRLQARILTGGHIGEVGQFCIADSALLRCARMSILLCKHQPELLWRAGQCLQTEVLLISCRASAYDAPIILQKCM